MTGKYRVGNATPTYVSTFTFGKYTFHIHRPVLDKREGWQLSYQGVPIQMMEVELKAKAILDFTKAAAEIDDFDDLLRQCVELNKKEYNL